MLIPTTLAAQYADAARDEPRILVVGAGVAGVTAAELLRRDGRHPVLVDRAPGGEHAGYMLALMPMVDRALDDLGVHERYRRASAPLARYAVHSHTGRTLREDPMSEVLAAYGDYRGISRGELIDVLSDAGCPVSFDTTVTAMAEARTGRAVTLSEAGAVVEREFDLVVVADGIHSTTRDLVLGGRAVEKVDTRWGGWVVWADVDGDPDLGEELWGDGMFLGVYPVLGRLGVFLGGPRTDTRIGPAAFADRMRRELRTVSPRFDAVLAAVAESAETYYWPLTDCRAPLWTEPGWVLLGDAAAGFLPTAGIGAGMAMESAWVLARTLRAAHPDTLGSLLRAYESAQRPRVESAQRNSRQLARLMLRRGRALAVAREVAIRWMSVEAAIRPIQRLLAEPVDPDGGHGAIRK